MRLPARQLALSVFTILGMLAPVLGHAQAAPKAPPRPVLVTAGQVWTGEGAPHAGWGVLVAQGRVQAVGPVDKLTAPPDAERIDLPGKTV